MERRDEKGEARKREGKFRKEMSEKGLNILVTGAGGFVGKNLCAALENIRDGKDRTRGPLEIAEIYRYDLDTGPALLEDYCRKADFVFNLAGVNRPKNPEEFMQGNFGFASTLLDTLKKEGNRCPIMISSSIQATLEGRFEGSSYGISKKAGEELMFDYGKKSGAKVLVYRFSNLFGKWCRPNYNSVVATFCNNIANDLPIQINDPETILDLIYIDDLVDEMTEALKGREHRCEFAGVNPIPTPEGRYCYVPVSHRVSLGEIAALLMKFHDQSQTLEVPATKPGSFEKKLYATYLSYLPEAKASYPLLSHTDQRGSFTELFHFPEGGQISVNISKPGITKGQHWHDTKVEAFVVIKGHGLIEQRKIGTEEIRRYEVSGDKPEAVLTLPGYAHNLINLSDTEDMVTLIWCSEVFAPSKPDTFSEKV